MKVKPGITQYAVAGFEADCRTMLQRVVEFGMLGVEPFFSDESHEFLNWNREQVGEFKNHLDELGITMCSTALGAFNSDSALIDADGKDKAVKLITKTLEFTSAAGGDLMLLCTFLASEPDTPEKKQNLLAVIKQVEPIAEKLGVRIALEMPLPASEILELLKNVNPDITGVYYDSGNSLAFGYDLAEEIELLGSSIFSLHIKDSVSGTLGSLHLGKGDLGFESMLNALRKIDYNGWVILETPLESDEDLAADIQLLKKGFDK